MAIFSNAAQTFLEDVKINPLDICPKSDYSSKYDFGHYF